jgi:sialate O-acetylesterase
MRLISLIFCFLPILLCGEVTVSSLIGNHMVLQRNEVVRIEGNANTESSVRVELAGMTVETTVVKGRWIVEFPARREGGPFILKIQGDNLLEFTDIYFGDVYLLSGQSNMEWPTQLINQAELELKDAFYPLIRMFTVERDQNFLPVDDLKSGRWDRMNENNARDFSAIGFLFARDLFKEKKVPIGLIDNAWGGSAIKTYMSASSFIDKPKYKAEISDYQSKQRNWTQLQSLGDEWIEGMKGSDVGIADKWFIPGTDRSRWDISKLPGPWEASIYPDFDGIVWYCRSFELENLPEGDGMAYLGRIDDDDVTYINGFKIGRTEGYDIKREYTIPLKYLKKGENQLIIKVTDTGYGGGVIGDSSSFYLDIGGEKIYLEGDWKSKQGTASYPKKPEFIQHNYYPTGKYNAMVYPLRHQKLAGVLWYQGESDTNNAYNYRWLFPRLVEGWRSLWKQDDLPFMYVQLANFYPQSESPVKSNWARLREAQHMTQALPYTAMVTAIDVGEAEDIHPRDKQSVAARLLRAAKALVYDEDLPYLHPELDYVQRSEKGYILHFQQTGGGLSSVREDEMVRGFAIPNEEGLLEYAEGKVLSPTQIYIKAEQTYPGMVRYLWADNPGEVQLYSAEGLPALPFERYVE